MNQELQTTSLTRLPKTIIRGQSPSNFLKTLISTAVENRASDIHLESEPNSLAVRFRIDGLLRGGPSVAASLKSGLISHIKVLANLDIAEKRRPQDGKIKYTYQSRSLDIRVSSIPALHGEKLVLRLLDPGSQNFAINILGLLPKQNELLLNHLRLRQGIILVTGPTGSGKTTTLYAMLNYLNESEVNIITVEDPIEYEIEGINQTKVHPEIGYTFANALRSFLRQDPDIIFIGEIRDTETARIAIRAALTGHLVLSTLHTNNSLETIVRLIDMGIDPYLLAATLKLIIAQRLVRFICTSCKGNIQNRKNRSCQQCRGLGYSGREGIFELLAITDTIKNVIHDGASMNKLKSLKEIKTMVNLEIAGQEKVTSGLTSIEEVRRVIS